jgi:uncharacterized phage protein (TIGR02218 family)
MGIKASEQQAQQEAVIETYDFLVVATHYRYTSYYQEQTIGGVLYEAEAIERSGDLSIDSEMSARECGIAIPADNALAVILSSIKEARTVQVTIEKRFSDDLLESSTVFVGKMMNVAFDAGVCKMNFTSVYSKLDATIPRVVLQSVCNNRLFDGVCALDADTWKTTAVVTVSNGGKTLSSATFGALGDDYFKAGRAYFPTTGEYRFITSHTGNDITLHYAFDTLASGGTVHAWPGCDKKPETCDDKFSNLTNFVGMPYVPLKDMENTPLTNA